jgi:hypothetical protein
MEGKLDTVKLIQNKKTRNEVLCKIAESAIIVDWVLRERERVKNEIRIVGRLEGTDELLDERA